MEAEIKRRYPNYKQKGAFSGAHQFQKANRSNTLYRVKKTLKQIPTYTLHQPARKHFPRRRVYVGGMHEQYVMDLKDIQSLAPYNNRKRYLLVVMDAFSKKAWMEALPNKTGPTTLKALEKIMARSGGVPRKIQVDEGTEFLNRNVKKYLNDKNIKLFWVASTMKCVLIERFIRTIFGKIQRYMTHNKTRKFVDKLTDFENLYNNSYHRSIKMTPNSVNKENEDTVRKNLYPELVTDYKPPKFKVGNHVLVARTKKIFEKGYAANYFEEVYKIVKIRETNPRVYILEALDGTPILGSFYAEQLSKVYHS